MSNLPGNPHYGDALVSMGQAVRNMPSEPEKLVLLGQADAALTLAFEQRTANLIAFAGTGDLAHDVRVRLNRTIADRMGLAGGGTK